MKSQFRCSFSWRVVLLAAAVLSPLPASGKVVALKGAALVMTMDPMQGEGPLGLVADGDVYFENDRILKVVPAGAPPGPDVPAFGVETIDVRGMIVMPGFVDTHNHLWQSLIRGCGTDAELPGWLRDCMFKTAARLGEDDTYAFVRLSTLDLVRTGVTTVVDWSIAPSPEMVAGNIRALKDSGLRYVYAYFDWDCTVEDCSKANETRQRIVEFKKTQIDPDPLAILQTASHPVPLYEPAVKNMAALARELGIDFNVHLHEHKDDPHGAINNGFPSQIELLGRADAINDRLLINHAVHLTEAEIKMLAARGVRVAHNPLSNMRLASGVMKLPEMRAAGMRVGLGLDGGANDTSDMFNLMRAAVGLQRATRLDAGVYPGVADVLRLATLGGAEALRLESRIGSLTPGKEADVIVIDPRAVNFAPRWDWLGQIVFNGQPENVKYVFVAGRALKRDGRVLAESAPILARAEAAAAKIRVGF
jgi:5-methylthioadenosine/S-adenosylhomocysteine deaminase